MGDDESIRKEVWEGKIPVCFMLADEDVGYISGERATPEPTYMMIPRVSYFPLVYDKLDKLYSRSVSVEASEKELWLSSEDIPLKWHYPVGVLYDLYGREGRLPWNIAVHFQNFPEELLHCQSKEIMESHFHSKIKEADCLKHRSEIIQSLTQEEFTKLWDGLKQGNFLDFWSVNKKMMLNNRSEAEPFKSIPFCIYRDQCQVFQWLIPPLSKDNEKQKLSDLLALYKTHNDYPSDHTALVHGIELPSSSPLQWLSECYSYPDNFIHICIVMKQTLSAAQPT